MRKIDISPATMLGILIGVISLGVFLIYGYRMMSYPILELASLSGQNIKAGWYVQGTISDCFTVPSNNPNLRVGNDAGFIIGGKVYESYTIPIADDEYIRVWICDDEDKRSMERLVQGDAVEIVFGGQIKEGANLSTSFYNKAPEFDQSKIAADYAIWQKDPETDKKLCLAGFYGLLVAALIYYFSGGIHITNVEPEADGRKRGTARPNYNRENELAVARKRLERYEEQERANRKKGLIGVLCVLTGCYIDFVLNVMELKILGLLILIFGIRKCWISFLNSRSRFAMRIAELFSIRTIQTKRQEEERNIKRLEKDKY